MVRRGFHLFIISLLLLLGGCGRRKRLPVTGEGYVAPISLNLRQDLAPRSGVVGQVKHGEKLGILLRKRRFVKVRTEAGLEGWADGRQLLATEGMKRLRLFNAWAKRQPSQGKATPLGLLNVHIDPNRLAPSFHQISPDNVVEIIDRAVTRRGTYDSTSGETTPQSANEIKDDWSLIRLSDGRSGWALSRMMTMNLPESVAMFAQGHRITSYHQAGYMPDRAKRTINTYLWTTISVPPEECQFDRFRLTVWNSRNRRFETGHIEANVRGYYPVTVHTAPDAAVQRFTLIYGKGREPVLERTFESRGREIAQVSAKPWTPPSKTPTPIDIMVAEADGKPEATWWEQQWSRLRNWSGR